MEQVLNALVEYVVNSGSFVVPEDPEQPGVHDWQAVPLKRMESTTQVGRFVVNKQFPDEIIAWGQRVPKKQCALVYGTAISFGGNTPNKRAYLVRAMLDADGNVIAVPLALFAHGPRGWFLSSQFGPPRFGVEQQAQNAASANSARVQPLDGRTLGMIIWWLNSKITAAEPTETVAINATPIDLE